MPYNTSVRGWMSESELQMLESWARQLPPNATVVEVGSFFGRSAYCWAATAPTATIHCFDWWDNGVILENPDFPIELRIEMGFPLPGDINSMHNFLSNTHACKNIKAQRIKSAAEISWPDSPTVDMFFLDAGHVNPADWEYIEFWLPRVKPGGWIAGHDLYADRRMPAVNENVERLEQLLGKPALKEFSSLWRIQK